MKIKSFTVAGLFGRKDPIHLDFNEDLNILTGRNGSGKTTVLKLLWYMMSENIGLALKEMSFEKATLVTTEYECSVRRSGDISYRIGWRLQDGQQAEYTLSPEKDANENLSDPGSYLHNLFTTKSSRSLFSQVNDANEKFSEIGSSIFLPTFRRIEGGFSTKARQVFVGINALVNPEKDSLDEALKQLSRKLTNNNHQFVSSLGTSDIESMLTRQHSNLSEKANKLQEQSNKLQDDVSKAIIEQIQTFEQTTNPKGEATATELLDEIRTRIENAKKEREAIMETIKTIMQPIDTLRQLVMQFIRQPGVRLTEEISFGDAARAIHSDALSSGEKQMLSFLAYNAFNQDTIIFIDEPELSLHGDWQRQLFPTLLAQQSSNQFVIATHSPFIYSKYPDKELPLDPVYGDEDE